MRSSVDGRRQRTTRSRENVLDAAAELFGTIGFHATSLRSLAASIGMTHAGIIRHYPTKEALLAELLERVEARRGDLYERVNSSNSDPRSRIRNLAESSLATDNMVELYTVLLGEGTIPSHPARQFVSARYEKVSEFLAEMFGPLGADIFAAWDGLQLIWLYLPDRVDLPRVLDSFIARRQAEAAFVHDLSPAAWGDVTPGASLQKTSMLTPTREEEIVAAAAAAFSRDGYRSTSLREIAAALGTSHGSLLYYFKNKEALLEAVLDSRDRVSARAIIEPRTALDGVYNRYRLAEYNEVHPELVDLYSVLVCEATHATHPAHDYFKRRFETVIDNFTSDLRKLAEAGFARPGLDPELEALLLVAIWDGWQLHAAYRSSISTPDRILAHLNTLTSVRLPTFPAEEDAAEAALVHSPAEP